MKYLKMLGLAAVAAMAFTAFAASSASATTLEVGGVTQAGSVTIKATAEQSISLARTDGSFANTCTESEVEGATTIKTGAAVTGPISKLTFNKCTFGVEVVDPGKLEIVHIAGTTDGTVYSENATVRTGSVFGNLHCVTGDTTHIGTLTGVDGTPATFATMHISAVLNCGFLVPSATWKGSYTVTSPHNLGVSA
ncbi:MAG TPA: hypothetical protein VFZ29_02185 [Solirubrobacterales bacterium]